MMREMFFLCASTMWLMALEKRLVALELKPSFNLIFKFK